MPANRDFKELLSAFNAEHVEYLVVGAHVRKKWIDCDIAQAFQM